MPANKKEMKEGEESQASMMPAKTRGPNTMKKPSWMRTERKPLEWKLVTDRKGILVEYPSIIHSTNIC